MGTAKIGDFRFTFTANVYEKKCNITKKLIRKIFDTASQRKKGSSKVVAECDEHELDGVSFKFSCMYFCYKTPPPFLPEIVAKNILHGFIALIEIDRYLFVFKDNISNITGLVDKYFNKLGFIDLCSIYNESSEAYESITTSSLNLSSTALRSRTFEASDLSQSMPMLSSSRQIPRNIKKRTENDALSVTPGSSRISSTRKRSNFDGIAKWAIEIVAELNSNQRLDHFMSNFAKPVSYAAMIDKLLPTGVFLKLANLEDEMGDLTLLWESKKRDNREVKRFELKTRHINKLFKTAKETFTVEKVGKSYVAKKDDKELFNVNMNKKAISVTGKILKCLICRNGEYEESLSRYIVRNRLIQVSFSDHTLQYCYGSLFKDDRIVNDIDGFLKSFKPFEELKNMTSEKGVDDITEYSTDFPEKSVFHFVENTLAVNDDYVVCDDLGTEWADHIGISRGHGSNPTISFYVSKHNKKIGIGASQFHDVVGQAIKNIGIINISAESFEEKANSKWSKDYNICGKITKISRFRKGDKKQIVDDLKQILAYPNTVRNMVLVVDFVSKSDLQEALMEIEVKGKICAHFVQLLWILASFMSTCRELSVSPVIVCQP